MGGVPSIPTDPSRELRVIGAGYSRTGTVTMQMALEQLLDGPVCHGGTQILGREDAVCKKWVQAYAAKRAGDRPRTLALLKELMAGFVGCTDMPPLDFISELMELYPNAKVVLVTRDPERWLESIKPVAQNASLWWLPYGMAFVPGWRWFPSLSLEFGTSTREYLGKDAPTDANPKPSTKLLLNWNESVKSMVPPEKLLVMDLKEGWEPLCKFLDLPVPDGPLPRANDTAAANKRAEEITHQLMAVWAGVVGVAGVAVFGAWKVWRANR